MEKYMYCSICLVTDTQFYIFTNTKEKIFLTNIFKQSGYSQKTNLEEYICYECRALLEKTYKFVQKALTAQHILKEINEMGNLTPPNFIEKIKEHDYKLRDILKLTIETQFTNCIPSEIDQITSKGEKKNNRKSQTNTSSCRRENEVVFQKSDTNKIKLKREVTSKNLTKETDGEINNENGDEMNSISEGDSNNKTEDKIKNENEIKVERDLDIEFKIEDEIECEFPLTNSDTIYTSNSPKDNTLEVNKGKTAYAQSKFMLTLDSIPNKRKRKPVKYDNIANISNDDSDNAETNKKWKRSVKNEESSDFEPVISDSLKKSMNLNIKSGRRLKRKKDLRVYPMKCDDCEAIIHEKRVHFHHYAEMHRDIEYPYKRSRKETFLCDTCGHVSNVRYKHMMHVATHSTDKKHACTLCPKKFNTTQGLQGHMARHRDDKYECDYCGKKFKVKGDVRLHIRTHTGEKPYKCHICGAGFAHNGNVGIHIRANHQQAPREPRNKKVTLKKSKATKKTSKSKRSNEDCEYPSRSEGNEHLTN